MQVSWIDPQHISALAESLRGPAYRNSTPFSAPPSGVTELPAAVPEVPEEELPTLVITPPVSDAEAEEIEELPAHTPSLSMVTFRMHLRSIREQAIQAGLLRPQVEPEEETEPEEPIELKVVDEEALDDPDWAVAVSAPPVLNPVELSPPSPLTIPVVPEPAAPPVIELDFEVPNGSIAQRLDAFAFWAKSRLGDCELLVVDEYGDLLWGPRAKSGLVLSTMMAWNAAIRASAQAASGTPQTLHQSLASGNTLTVIPCSTRLGMVQVALVRGFMMLDAEVDLLKRGLSAAMDMPS